MSLRTRLAIFSGNDIYIQIQYGVIIAVISNYVLCLCWSCAKCAISWTRVTVPSLLGRCWLLMIMLNPTRSLSARKGI